MEPVTKQPASRPSRLPFVLICAAMVLYAATFSTMGILQYRAGNITYTDTATFEEMLWRTLHGEFLMCSGFEHNFLGEHVQVIHLLLLPIYIIYPSLQTLMAAQSVALALGALPVYALSVHVLKSRWLGCALAVSYLLYTPMQMVNLEAAPNTFRPIAFSIPLLLAAFYYLVRGRLVAFSIFAVLVLLCKEEFGLILFMLGLYTAVVLRRRRFGLAWSAIGLAWFLLSLMVIIPYFRGGPSHSITYYSELGATPGEIAWHIVAHPIRTLQIALAPEKLGFFLVMFLPVGFLCVLSPLTLAVALPAFAVCLLSTRYATYMPWFHYHAPIVPFVLAATIFGIRNLARWAGRADAARAGRRVAGIAGALVVVCGLLTNVIYSKSPVSVRFYDPKAEYAYYGRLYVVTPSAREIPNIVQSVPREMRVSASIFLATYFTHHARVYNFPQGVFEEGAPPADYIVVNLKERWFGDSPAQKETLEKLDTSAEYEKLPAPEGFLIYRRVVGQAEQGSSGGS